jgi:hypothetical protein
MRWSDWLIVSLEVWWARSRARIASLLLRAAAWVCLETTETTLLHADLIQHRRDVSEEGSRLAARTFIRLRTILDTERPDAAALRHEIDGWLESRCWRCGAPAHDAPQCWSWVTERLCPFCSSEALLAAQPWEYPHGLG